MIVRQSGIRRHKVDRGEEAIVGLFDIFKRTVKDDPGAEQPLRERRKKPRRNPFPGTRILVVDDSPTIIAALRSILQQQNKYVVIEALDAESGLELAINDMPDLIFLDLVLPKMSGFDALRRLRKNEITREIPIIMMSGNEAAIEEFYVQRIGADDFIKKPFSRGEVFARVERLLDEGGALRRPTSNAAAR
jgi:DNA-binding response OmpR family regulator